MMNWCHIVSVFAAGKRDMVLVVMLGCAEVVFEKMYEMLGLCECEVVLSKKSECFDKLYSIVSTL